MLNSCGAHRARVPGARASGASRSICGTDGGSAGEPSAGGRMSVGRRAVFGARTAAQGYVDSCGLMLDSCGLMWNSCGLMLDPCGLMLDSCWTHVGSCGTHVVDSCWTHVDSCWTHVGHMWTHVELMWTHVDRMWSLCGLRSDDYFRPLALSPSSSSWARLPKPGRGPTARSGAEAGGPAKPRWCPTA